MMDLSKCLVKNNRIFLIGQKKLINIFFISQLFFLFSFGSLGSLSITIPFFVGAVYFIFSLVGVLTNSIIIEKKSLMYYVVLILTVFLCSILSKYSLNLKSFLLLIYYFSFFVLLDCRHNNDDFIKVLKSFIIISTFINFYSIYQFISYNFIKDLPFKELISENFWVKDYNTIQVTKDSNLSNLIKPHAIYAEASFLSRYSGIVLLSCYLMKKKFDKITFVFIMVVNIISLIISLSGSGIIIVMCGLIYLIIKSKKRWQILFLLLVLSLGIIIIGNNAVINYFLGRFDELNITNNYNSSGYYRFILPLKIGIDNIQSNFLGYGIGNDDIAFNLYNAAESNISNGFGKIFVECGVLGLILMILFFILLKPKKYSSEVFSIMLLCLVLCNFVSTFMEITFWSTALFIASNRKLYLGAKKQL